MPHQEDLTFVEKEQKRIERWAQQNDKQLIAVGKKNNGTEQTVSLFLHRIAWDMIL